MADKLLAPAAELFPIEKECFHIEFQEYFRGKRQNFFLSITAFRPTWEALQLLNDIWNRELSDLEHLREQTHLLPKLIFSAAHAKFLMAIELSFSCCIGDAYSILRDAIEAVAHAHKILKEPTIAGVAWSDKHKGRSQKAAYKRIFEENKKDNLFPSDVPGLRQLHTYYGQFSEFATHSSVTSIGKSFEDKSAAGTLRWGYRYFETNPQRLAGYLNALLQASAHLEEVLFGSFETRLNLDSELVRMRAQFSEIRRQQNDYLRGIYQFKSDR
jgi:hypothetical protein